MLKNAYLDAKIGVDPAENGPRKERYAGRWRRWTRPSFLRGRQTTSHDTSLFPRLVLGWINADFRVQIRIFQHFSRSTRKSSSREQILQNFAKIWQNLQKKVVKILQNFANFPSEKMIFLEILKNAEKCVFGRENRR